MGGEPGNMNKKVEGYFWLSTDDEYPFSKSWFRSKNRRKKAIGFENKKNLIKFLKCLVANK
jgi:hypothetical protein